MKISGNQNSIGMTLSLQVRRVSNLQQTRNKRWIPEEIV
jgi:hypothetical protein